MDQQKKKRGMNKISANIDRDDDDDGDDYDDINVDESNLTADLYVKPEDRRSTKILTQFERVRILGDRTAQIAQGAKPMIKNVEGMDPKMIAQLELESKLIPIKIIRPLPNGRKEIWELKELELKKKYIIYGFLKGDIDKDKINIINEEYKKGGRITGYSNLLSELSNDNKDITEISKIFNKQKKNTKKNTKFKNIK